MSGGTSQVTKGRAVNTVFKWTEGERLTSDYSVGTELLGHFRHGSDPCVNGKLIADGTRDRSVRRDEEGTW